MTTDIATQISTSSRRFRNYILDWMKWMSTKTQQGGERHEGKPRVLSDLQAAARSMNL